MKSHEYCKINLMSEAFNWMLKKEDFKKHFTFLVILNLMGNLSLFLLLTGKIHSAILIGLSILLIIITTMPILGYFWDLTENVIDAEKDISANSIYNGKIKTFLKIEFPELKFFKLSWRGIASIVASILLLSSYLLLVYLPILLPKLTIGFITSLGDAAPLVLAMQNRAYLIGIFCYYIFFPALFWNYAKNNSVFSVLNIPKAVYIIGNYPLRYICKILQMGLVYILNIVIVSLLSFRFGLLEYIIIAPISTYFLFVYAYILGSLAPNQEF